MTIDIDRAAEVILPWIEREYGYPDDNADSAAKRLADAGLLRPPASERYDRTMP